MKTKVQAAAEGGGGGVGDVDTQARTTDPPSCSVTFLLWPASPGCVCK